MQGTVAVLQKGPGGGRLAQRGARCQRQAQGGGKVRRQACCACTAASHGSHAKAACQGGSTPQQGQGITGHTARQNALHTEHRHRRTAPRVQCNYGPPGGP